MMKRTLLTLIAAVCLPFAGADEKPEFLISPGASLCPPSAVSPDAVTAAENLLCLKKRQYQQGVSDYLSVLDAEIRVLKLNICLLRSDGEKKNRLLQAIRKADSERMKLVEARYRSGGISELEYRTEAFRCAWERLAWENSPEHAAVAVQSAETLEATVQDCLRLGQADRAQCLIAAITCGEAKLRQKRNAADIREQAAAVQKLYNELAALYEARAKHSFASIVKSVEAELAARCFEREYASHVLRDADVIQRTNADIQGLLERLRDDYYFAAERGEVSQEEVKQVEVRQAEEIMRKYRESHPEKTAMIQRILALADYSFHEENLPSLVERLFSGLYVKEKEPEGGVEYLKISGDGCSGRRMFIRTAKGELYLLQEDWEDKTDELQLYLPKSKTWTTCSNSVPKSFMEKDSTSGLWTRLQQWLQRQACPK